MYKLEITATAKIQLKQIEKIYEQNAINNAFREIKEDPFVGKPLSRELTGRFSYRVGIYRIIYKINYKDKIVRILTAGHRAIVYE